MKYTLKAYSIKEQGPRPKQEDSMFPEHETLKDNDRLFIVCDGMGGHSAGEVASGTVCQALSSYILDKCPDAEGSFSDEIFKSALNHAFDILDTKDNGAAKKMGTTMTFLKLHDEGATIAHIGDSRVYHIRPGKDAADTEILFQTYDHSLVNDLVKIGELTPEEAKHSNQKNIITRAMQPNMERRPRADIYHTHDIKPGDYFMLCSDGILEQMEDENIKYIFSPRVKSPEDKVKMIIDVTAQNHDNHTAILVHITDVIDPIPVCPPVPVVETEPNIEKPADNIDNTANIMPEEEEKEDNKISNIVYIVMTIIVLAGAIVYALIPGESNDEPKIANTKVNSKKKEPAVSQPGNDALSPVEKDGLWGFKDNTGKIVIPCEYDSAGVFSDGFAAVELNGKWGFIDKAGNEVIPCKYEGIKSSFSNGKAEVMENGKLKSIDKTGNEIIAEEENSQTPEIENMQEQEIAVRPDHVAAKKEEKDTVPTDREVSDEPVEPDSSDATTQVEDTNGSSQDTGETTNQE